MSSTPPARVLPFQAIHYIRKTLTFNSGAVTVGTIPAGATIMRALSGAQVNVVFNAGTNNHIDIGTAANDDLYGTDLAGGTIAFVPFDEAVTQTVTADTTITAKYDETGTAATTGSAEIIVSYVI